MSIEHMDTYKIHSYFRDLQIMAALTLLNSSNQKIPMLGYREVENIYCGAFDAKNVSREDIAIDAIYNTVGVGIKTFLLGNGNSFQKIAEFNQGSKEFTKQSLDERVTEIVNLRNSRLEIAVNRYKLTQLIYHCVTRAENSLIIYELPMHSIDLNSIHGISEKLTSKNITFYDKYCEYNYSFTKNTLYMRFITPNKYKKLEVEILDNPLKILREVIPVYLGNTKPMIATDTQTEVEIADEYVVLPLFAPSSKNSEYKVERKSGLNQWAASGRHRNFDEVYIPIPSWIHREFPDFFPPRKISFDLELPGGRVLSAKVCQSNGKALMSNPNHELGKWILREVLKLHEGELLTYDMLAQIGIDSVIITKKDDEYFHIDFARIDAYYKFCTQYGK
jgi:hypothetical protein